MTNEELAMRIKAGESELMSELWAQVERFVAQQARKFVKYRWSEVCASAGLTYDDLYVTGYFALPPAVEAFDPEKGYLFMTYFGFHLTRVFYSEAGISNHNGQWHIRRDPLGQASSLEAELYESKDGEGLALEDCLKDENAERAFAEVDDGAYYEQLQADLAEALDSLRPRDAEIVKGYYLQQMTQEALAEQHEVSASLVRQIQARALKTLSKHKALKEYRDYVLTRSLHQVSFTAFKQSGMSQQEYFISKLDDYERKLFKKESR